ncbi:MAG: rhodanese-like domain-containing protein [Actinomycetota bacterium]|nr:rhodanese-like domain-containing protein [Actinomycetota bacterium]
MGLFRQKDGVGPRQAAELAERQGALILDVRERDEWDAGHVPGAAHIPLGELAQRFKELPQGRRIVAACRSGNRSALATESLRRAGLQVDNLEGGMKEWQKAGLPLEPADGRVA